MDTKLSYLRLSLEVHGAGIPSACLPTMLRIAGTLGCSALVRVVHQGVGLPAPPDRHHQRVGDELGGHGVAHRPANHPAREQVDDDGDVQPRGMTLTLSDWVYEGIVNEKSLLTTHPDYSRCRVAWSERRIGSPASTSDRSAVGGCARWRCFTTRRAATPS